MIKIILIHHSLKLCHIRVIYELKFTTLYVIFISPNILFKGHSVGELGCAYADGCFTAEQMILSAYSRGLASIETPFIKGSMAAVGLGYNQVGVI